MRKIIAAVPLCGLLLLPLVASAHEHQTFEINGITYTFGIGSSNEPVVVDDKSGVELQIQKAGILAGHEDHHAGETLGGVEGLEKTLKVELISGSSRTTMDLEPVWSAPGSYHATFYPTVATQLSYRIFGTIDEIPVDLLFTCIPRHDMEGETVDTTRTEISPGVVRVEKRGGFGCPMEKSALGFPEAAATLEETKNSSRIALFAALGSGFVSLFVLAMVVRRRS